MEFLIIYVVSLMINVVLIRHLNSTQGAAPTSDSVFFWICGPITMLIMLVGVALDISSRYRFSGRVATWIRGFFRSIFLSKDHDDDP